MNGKRPPTLLFLALLFSAIFAYGQQQERVAIINTVDDGDSIKPSDLAYLTSKLRETAVNVLPKQRYGIMTTESIVAFLGSQERAQKECKEASCLADLGRKVNADYVAQARIGRFDNNLSIGVELYSSKSGVMVGSFTGNSKSISGLLTIIDEKAPALFKKMPGVSGGSVASPFVAEGISGFEKAAAGYEMDDEKRYVVNLSTEPSGAVLSFDGLPSTNCAKTPCKAELREGKTRIIAALEQYETADTTVSIKQNNQNIAITLKPNFGILEIKPAYSDGIGSDKQWDLSVNGKPNSLGEIRLSPNKYAVKLNHECYEDISFNAGINKGKREVFDMAGKITLKKGGLALSAEKNGEPASEPVYVNGKQVGETPFSGSVPICAKVEIGNNRNAVDVKLKYNEKVKHTHKVYNRGYTIDNKDPQQSLIHDMKRVLKNVAGLDDDLDDDLEYDDKLFLLVAISKDYMEIWARGGTLPKIFYKECQDGKTTKLCVLHKESEKDLGKIMMSVYSKSDSAYMDTENEFITNLSKVKPGAVVATLTESSSRRLECGQSTAPSVGTTKKMGKPRAKSWQVPGVEDICINGKSAVGLKPRSVYDELAKSLIMIHNRFIDSPDADEIIIVIDDDPANHDVAFNKITNIINRAKSAGFYKISIGCISNDTSKCAKIIDKAKKMDYNIVDVKRR